VKPGLSRLFPHRLVLRVQEMLQRIRHGGLPGVAKTKLVKTHGCREWQTVTEIERLFTVRRAEEYKRLVTQAVVTLLEGNRPSEQTVDDAAALSRLEQHTPTLGADHLSAILQDVMTQHRVLKDQLKAEKPRKRPRPPTPDADEVDEPEAAAEIDEAPSPSEAAPPPPPPPPPPRPPTPPPPSPAVHREASGSSVVSGSSAGVDWQSESSVQSEDSRSVQTEDSFEEDEETVATDPSGLSLVSRLSDLEDEEGGNDGFPSPACSSGSD